MFSKEILVEEVEGLPIETVYNLIHANVMSLEEFIEWVNHKDRESVFLLCKK